MRRKHKLILFACLPIALLLAVRWGNSLAAPAPILGVVDGRLAACPDSPNCVSTQAEDSGQHIEPIALATTPQETMRELGTILQQMPRCRIVTVTDNYLHAEFRTLLCGFVDDVVFWFDASVGVLHFRSSSRVGYSDLGVNRKRMEEIRHRFHR